MNGTFYDQLGGVTGVFEQWGPCERTVVMCALARRIPWNGLKMLQRCVEEAIIREAPPAVDCDRLEREANDEALIASLIAIQTDTNDIDGGILSLERLVSLAPLCGEAAALQLACAAPRLLPRAGSHRPALRRLLSCLLLHPSLSHHHHHQRSLTQCLKYLEGEWGGPAITDPLWSPPDNIWGSNGTFRRTIGKNIDFRFDVSDYNNDLQESFSKNGRDVDISGDEDRLNFDATISQPKPRSNSLTPPSNFCSSESLSEEPMLHKPRSFSLSSERSLSQLSKLSVFVGGSETRLDVLRSQRGAEPGMSMVGPWLKSLRLHKYIWLFSNITYDQMMAMDEEYLEKLGVTLGARHKLLLCIARLRERVADLIRLGTSGLGTVGSPATVLGTVRAALSSPLPPHPAPAAQIIVSLLESASQALLSGGAEGRREDEDGMDLISLHCWLVEKALHHESFQLPELSDALKRMRYRLPPRQFYHRLSDLPHRRPVKPRYRTRVPPPRPKSHSYPPSCPSDIHYSLDALCLQMTQQAID